MDFLKMNNIKLLNYIADNNNIIRKHLDDMYKEFEKTNKRHIIFKTKAKIYFYNDVSISFNSCILKNYIVSSNNPFTVNIGTGNLQQIAFSDIKMIEDKILVLNLLLNQYHHEL